MSNKINKKTIALVCIMLLAVAGMYLGAYLTQRHYQLQNNGETEHTFVCSLSSSFNCDLVNSSPYAELFGVPVALWGVLFSIYLFYVAKFIIGALCPYCIMMYAVNLGLFVATKVASGMSYAEMRSVIYSSQLLLKYF